MPAGKVPAAMSASLAAWTRSNMTAKMLLCCSLAAMRVVFSGNTALVGWRRLDQIRGRVKVTGMVDESVAVGHAGHEVGHSACPAGGVGRGEILRPFARHIIGTRQVVPEQVAHDLLGVTHDAHDPLVPV